MKTFRIQNISLGAISLFAIACEQQPTAPENVNSVAVSALQAPGKTWNALSGMDYAAGIAFGANTYPNTLHGFFLIKKLPVSGGYKINRWLNDTKTLIPGGLTAIDYANGRLVGINQAGNAFYNDAPDATNGGNWTTILNSGAIPTINWRATKIAVGTNRDIYAISNERHSDPSVLGGKIYKWNGSINNWTNKPGWAQGIDIDNNGDIWLVDGNGKVWRYPGGNFNATPDIHDIPVSEGGVKLYGAQDVSVGNGNVIAMSRWAVSGGSDFRLVWYTAANATWIELNKGMRHIKVNESGNLFSIDKLGIPYRLDP